jgi:hypothetical protein
VAAKNTNNRVSSFTGLDNVHDPLTLGLGAQVQVDNVDITNKNHIVRMRGYKKVLSNTLNTGAYATKDLQRLYVVDNGNLLQVFPDMSSITLKSGLNAAPMYFTEVNGVVYYSNGIDFGTLDPDGYEPWGIAQPASPTIADYGGGSLVDGVYQVVCTLVDANGMESSNSDVAVIATLTAAGRIFISNIQQTTGYTTNVYATKNDGDVFFLLRQNSGTSITYDATDYDTMGRELPFWNRNLPRGSIPAYFGGRIYTAEWYPQTDTTTIWRSLPLHFHQFDPGGEGITVPGQVVGMCATRETHFTGNERLTQKGVADALLIGTDREIYTWDDDQLVLLASYGMVPGWHITEFRGKLYFWTLRGLCRALPFENLTESTVSVAPGLSAGGTVLERNGTHRYVAALHQGGVAFNPG